MCACVRAELEINDIKIENVMDTECRFLSRTSRLRISIQILTFICFAPVERC
jgi:hypothetical protein